MSHTDYCIDAVLTLQTGVSGSSDLHLVSVHIVLRHGDRSPLHSLQNIVNKPFNCQLNRSHSNTNDSLTEFLRRMQRSGRRHSNSSYAGYSLYPAADHCESGSLTEVGVQQHIMNGAFLRQAYITQQKLFKTDDSNLGEQVSSVVIFILPSTIVMILQLSTKYIAVMILLT